MFEADYGMTRHLEMPFDTAIERTTAALKEQGFGVLTEIDVKATLKKKIDVDFRRYTILGACNPALAHQALTAEPLVGLLLPCNVVVAEADDGGTVVSMISPPHMFQVVARDDMDELVSSAETRLRAALAAI